MKRKRQSREAQRAKKRAKTESDSFCRPTHPLLQQYYPEVVTLRQYLASRLSKKRRRRLQQYGRDATTPSVTELSHLLDSVLVGTSKHVQVDDSSFLEEDITLFTQQVSDADTSLHLTPGHFKQSEIVDFVIWALFKRQTGNFRPQHVLCQNYQRFVTAHDEEPGPEIVHGIPGIYSNGPHENVEILKGPPWEALPGLLGRAAERVIGDMLIGCGIFQSVEGSSNFIQISGVLMSDLKVLPNQEMCTYQDTRGMSAAEVGPEKRIHRALGEIRLVRHRMLYARPVLNAKGAVKCGLKHVHVLNRYRDVDAKSETEHVMKYVFPLQFDLHNVFTSEIDPNDTAQQFKDYTIREQEIYRQKCSRARKQVSTGGSRSLPRRLRGLAEELVESIRRRHRRCAYSALLEFYCPRPKAAQALADSSIHLSTNTAGVSAFCRAAISAVFPARLWGDHEVRRQNVKIIHRNIDRFVRLRRYESLSLHDVLQGLQLGQISWLMPPNVAKTHRMSLSDFSKRKELMAELIYFVFDSYLMPLIRGHFHVTESNVNRNQLFYFRHDVWRKMSEPAMASLKYSMLEECSNASVSAMMATRALGISRVRLLPKEVGMRPIINLRRRVQKTKFGKTMLGRSINSILTPTFSILNHEKGVRPARLGSALFSTDDIFPRLQSYRRSLQEQGLLGTPLYFAKVDVQSCFDTIPQKRLMTLARKILSRDEYQISKYSRAKLLGNHSQTTPSFGAKPSWKFLTKATSNEQPFHFSREVDSDTLEGRTRSVYINGLAQKKERRDGVLALLQEHVEANLIKIGKKFYRQKEGIPQGSILSSLLCSYFYAELEQEVLGFMSNGRSVLLRLIDDFLVISTDKRIAERFMQVMHAGIPEFGVQVKIEKSRANFDLQLEGTTISKLTDPVFPYCGTAIDVQSLDMSKDKERRRKTDIAGSITVEFSKLPGQTFYRKTLNALKLQMHAMLLSTSYNRIDTVLSNLYHAFNDVAQKSYHYIKALPAMKQPADDLVIRAVDDLIRLACVLMRRRKRTSKDVIPYECSVKNAEARWLACTAFRVVFRRRQTKHRNLLAWLEKQLGLPGLRIHERRLDKVVVEYG
ncbi:Telomerase reverse transcriptase [Pseudocercospora fuligena]|uniref:Telomerase reverse transcriptase n=1 Tax=Pseudocercospora fuligena TaxID=685502 RepID=A0A8H6RSE9_9PEZI|nr:Telomerase reverse transcriptase [Pseudocercospora fuligena]